MSSECHYVLLKAAGQTQIMGYKTKVCDYYTIEEWIPCPASSDEHLLKSIQQSLLHRGYQIEETCGWSDVPIAMLLDFDAHRLIVSGLGRRWKLPETTAARFAFSLLRQAGWRDWDLIWSPYGCNAFAQFEQEPPPIRYQAPYSRSAPDVLKLLKAENPWYDKEYHDPLMITVKQANRYQHYVIPDDGHSGMGSCLNLGPELLDCLASSPEGPLLTEAEVSSTLLIDRDRQLIFQGIEAINIWHSSLPYEPAALQALWPDWQFKVNFQGYLGYLREAGMLPQYNHLLLSAEGLAEHIESFYLDGDERYMLDQAQQALTCKSLAALTLTDWFEGVLFHPRTRTHLLRLLRKAVTLEDIPIWV